MLHDARAALHAARARDHPDALKARAHRLRAEHHAGFGDERRMQLALTPPAERKTRRERWSKLPTDVQWMSLMHAGCDKAADVARGASKEERLGLYDMYLTHNAAPAPPRRECALVPEDSAFTASCERFYSNCDREMMRLAVADLDSVRLRDVLQRHRVEISAGTFRPAIGDWDVSRVTDMSGLFADWADFNQPIGNWDTSRVTDMSRMFANATAFNQPLTWDARSVVSLYAMFRNATSFNSPIVLRRTGGVVNMSSMFEGAEQFNQPLALDTGNVKSIARMFAGARSFARAAELSDLRVCDSITGVLEGAHLDAHIRTEQEPREAGDGCAIS